MIAKKLRLMMTWIEMQREDLEANWKLLSDEESYFKIDPLK